MGSNKQDMDSVCGCGPYRPCAQHDHDRDHRDVALEELRAELTRIIKALDAEIDSLAVPPPQRLRFARKHACAALALADAAFGTTSDLDCLIVLARAKGD